MYMVCNSNFLLPIAKLTIQFKGKYQRQAHAVKIQHVIDDDDDYFAGCETMAHSTAQPLPYKMPL